MENYCIMTKTEYDIKDGTKTVWELIETEQRLISRESYNNIINSCGFFRRLGGSEYAERAYTCRGYLVDRLISKSPDRQSKIIRDFEFDIDKINKYIEEKEVNSL